MLENNSSEENENIPQDEKNEILTLWNPQLLRDRFFSMTIIASRNSGKTYFLSHIFQICEFAREYEFICVMCPSVDTLDGYSEFIPSSLLFSEYREDVLTKLIFTLEELEVNGKSARGLVILDDLCDGHETKRAKVLTTLYNSGRHKNISVVFISQKASLLPTTCRTNSDVLILGRTTSAEEKEFLMRYFLRGIKQCNSKSEENAFNFSLLRDYTKNYRLIVLDYLDNQKTEFNDIVHYYKV